MKILILRLSSFGDIIHTLPVLTLIKKNFPNAEIHWLIKNEWADLLENHQDINYIHKLSNSFFGYIKTINNLKQEKFDLILEMQTLMKTSILAYLIGGKKIIGLEPARESLAKYFWTEKVSTINILDDKLHIIERNCQIFKSKFFGNLSSEQIKNLLYETSSLDLFKMPIEINYKNSPLAVDGDELGMRSINSDKKLIALAPETRWISKNWPLENWQALANELSLQTNYQVIILGSKALQPYFKQNTHIINLAGKTSLKDLKNLIPKFKLLIGGDSGLIHLASAYNIKTLGLYGSTSPARTGSWRGNSIYLNLNCSPCHKRKCHLTGNNYQSCLKNITVSKVLNFIS